MINLEHQSRKYFLIILNIYEKSNIFDINVLFPFFFIQYKYLQNIFNILFYDTTSLSMEIL